MMRRVFDAHLHLDESIPGEATYAVTALCEQMRDAGVERAVLLQLQTQRWTINEVADAVRGRDCLVPFVNLHPYEHNVKDQLLVAIREMGFKGLKLHPRLQKFSIEDERTYQLVNYAGGMGIPVVIDAFPDGDWLMQGFSPIAFARLATACKNSKIVIAHIGGHHVIDFLMLSKRIKNIYFDISFSLLYYRGSSVIQDILYSIKSLRGDRIFYGSDYPDRSLGASLIASITELESGGLSDILMDRLLYSNAKEFFG